MNSMNAAIGAVTLGLVGGAFVFGLYVGEGRIPAIEQVAQVVNKDRDVLTQQVASDPVDFTPYWRVWNVLERKFIPHGTSTVQVDDEPVDTEDRLYRSIEGLVASYKDPYTVFMRPQVSNDFKIATRGALEGIGAVVGERDSKLLVVQPLEGSPAAKAGLQTEDQIQKINGVTTEGLRVDDAVKMIRGERGTEVILTIKRKGDEVRDVPIVRGTIEIPSTAHAVVEREVPKLAVKPKDTPASGDKPTSGDTSTDDAATEDEPVETEVKDFYLLRLFNFSQTSINAFERELKDFKKSGSDSLILDLRGNPGGYLEAAVNIAGWFLPDGSVAVREFRGPEKKEVVHRTRSRPLFDTDAPNIAILVNKASASASEILAGALKEHGVATVVGTNTFGKGSVQELVDITDDLALKVTVARWYTPDGVSISQGGLAPDILVDTENASSADPFVDEAIDFLAGV